MRQAKIDEITNSLFKRRTLGIKPGLERMVAACHELGNPQDCFRVIHVAGTNGKGSTSTFVSSILKESGLTVGLFTSPHIFEFRERFKVNGISVTDEQWAEVWLNIEPVCNKYNLTFFEISALLAFMLFSKLRCSYAVIEVGLGGRLDATNVVKPILSLITPISIDHTEYLGDSLREIAFEKLGIVKERVPFIISGDNSDDVIELSKEISLARSSKMFISNSSDAQVFSRSIEKQHFVYKNKEYRLSLAGDFQVSNATLAIEASNLLNISEKDIRNGLEKAKIIGRVQELYCRGKRVFLDVAHNPASVLKINSA